MYDAVLGPYGETTRNNNGERMLEYCSMNNLIITNTFFKHKDIHKYTREMISRNEKSIIDYIMTERTSRNTVIDTRVKRGPEIGSDHYLVVAKIRDQLEIKDKSDDKNTRKVVEFETIRTYKLQNEEVAEKYKNTTAKKFVNVKEY